jgi:hypothetical protein
VTARKDRGWLEIENIAPDPKPGKDEG